MGEETDAVDGKFARSGLGADRAPLAAKRDGAADPGVFGELIELRDVPESHIRPVVRPQDSPIVCEYGADKKAHGYD